MLKIPLHIYLIIFLLLAGVFTVFALKNVPLSKTVNTTKSNLVEESMQGVHATRFDQEGHLVQDISMKSWWFYKGETTTHLEFPALKIYQQDGSVWEITADKGKGFQQKVHGKLEKLELDHNVVIQRKGNQENALMQLNTPDLIYLPAKELAFTDSLVTVTAPQMVAKAKGMRAYLNTQHIEFLNQVKCDYAKS